MLVSYRSHFHEFLGLPGPLCESKPLVFLQAIADDSASDIGDRRLFVAGYLNTAQVWGKFADAWAAELRAEPSIDYLKMVEAQNRRGQFKGWSEAAIDQKLRDLLKVITQFDPVSFEMSISRNEFWDRVRDHAPRGLANAHFPCVLGVIFGVSRFIAEQKLTTPVFIDFIFDEQNGVSEDIRMSFDLMKQALPRKARKLIPHAPVFRNDREFVPIQAADFLAWHIRREHESGGAVGSLPMASELRGSHHFVSYVPTEMIAQWGQFFSAQPGVEVLKTKGQWQRFKQSSGPLLASRYVPAFGSRWQKFFYRVRERLARLIGL